ncbi:hypothetical protein [Vibrio alfacsensis]|uniref:hypothetical protein n=1 Tax=Vibrio alfacsensis TaxID=1074311 RepID=UPI0040690C3D
MKIALARIIKFVTWICVFSGYTQVAYANVLERQFMPQVSIFKDHSSTELEIRVKESNHAAQYRSSVNSFLPISMPFNVISKTGTPIDYRLSLLLSQHYCGEGDGNNLTGLEPLTGVTTTLDGKDLALVGSGQSGSEGYVYSDKTEQEHAISLSFPEVSQLAVTKQCYGSLGILAELTTF